MHWPPLLRVTVAEHSMEPALRPGDWLLVWRTHRVRPGQIVLARHPGRPDMLIVKRAARRVDGGWWLESDNPDAGAVDSRRFGPVPAALVEGRLLARYWRPRRPAKARSLPSARSLPLARTPQDLVLSITSGLVQQCRQIGTTDRRQLTDLMVSMPAQHMGGEIWRRPLLA